jgi:hypothetical protein
LTLQVGIKNRVGEFEPRTIGALQGKAAEVILAMVDLDLIQEGGQPGTIQFQCRGIVTMVQTKVEACFVRHRRVRLVRIAGLKGDG